jgi:lysozyme family protein
MTRSSFPSAVSLVLAQEGGYVDDPRDPGGATNRGITLRTLERARGQAVRKADVRALSEDEARAIYRRFYWDAVRGDDLPAGLDLATFDIAVHSGPSRAGKLLQGALGVSADGAIGPVTLAAAATAPPERTIRAVMGARLAMLKALPTWPAFGRGWRRRVAAVEKAALALALR